MELSALKKWIQTTVEKIHKAEHDSDFVNWQSCSHQLCKEARELLSKLASER